MCAATFLHANTAFCGFVPPHTVRLHPARSVATLQTLALSPLIPWAVSLPPPSPRSSLARLMTVGSELLHTAPTSLASARAGSGPSRAHHPQSEPPGAEVLKSELHRHPYPGMLRYSPARGIPTPASRPPPLLTPQEANIKLADANHTKVNWEHCGADKHTPSCPPCQITTLLRMLGWPRAAFGHPKPSGVQPKSHSRPRWTWSCAHLLPPTSAIRPHSEPTPKLMPEHAVTTIQKQNHETRLP